ncbi:MAG: protein kinase [Streptosporangiales bacterium]|nr:protein kinase [Streptosporangiales bacterium]
MTSDAATTPLRRLGAYELRSRIGEGGMGVVYRALGPDGRPVAVKVLRPHVAGDREGRARFAREVRAMRRVHGPHVAEVLDADVTAETPYVVTRYVDGPPLYRVVADDGPLSERALVRLGTGLADALQAIHRAGVVHRDLKPGNVLMLGGEPVVIDFGIAQVADESRLTSTGMLIGTPGYLAPEVVEGKPASWASDVHSWAATVAYAATGRPPFGRGAFEAVIFRVFSGNADLDGVPQRLLPVLHAALHRDPQRRPRPDELGTLVERAMATRPRAAAAFVPPLVVAPAHPRPTRPLTVAPAAAQAPPAESRPVEVRPQQPPVPEQAAEKRPRNPFPLRPRPLYTTLLAVVAALAGAVAPFVALLLLSIAFAVARTVHSQAQFVTLRRERKGRSATDGLVAVTALPWHSVRSALYTVLTIPIAAIGALALVVLVALFAPAGLPATNTHVLGGLLVGTTAVLAWWGLDGEGVRLGGRRMLGWVAQPRPVAIVSGLVLGAVAFGLLLEAMGSGVHWWPLQEDPRALAGAPRAVIGEFLRWLSEHRFF